MLGQEREGTNPRPWRNNLRATPTLVGWSFSIRPLQFEICNQGKLVCTHYTVSLLHAARSVLWRLVKNGHCLPQQQARFAVEVTL